MPRFIFNDIVFVVRSLHSFILFLNHLTPESSVPVIMIMIIIMMMMIMMDMLFMVVAVAVAVVMIVVVVVICVYRCAMS